MTLSGRARTLRRSTRSTSQMIAATLVVLAVVASLFLIFSDSVQVLRIGLMAALWAAVIGAIAMTKYRRESAAGQAKIRDLHTVYELQLEREVSARREYEAEVETRVRSELTVEASELAALRVELAALRGSLEILFEGRMPPERVAIDAETVRPGALAPGRPAGPARPTVVRPSAAFAPRPAYADPAAGAMFATPFDEPVTAEVSVVPDGDEAVVPDGGFSVVPDGGFSVVPDGGLSVVPHDESGPASVADGRARAQSRDDVADPPATRIDDNAADVPDRHVEMEPPPPPRRTRRRTEPDTDDRSEGSGAHSSGLTVAQILANVQAGADSAGTARSGRRRRE